MRKRLLIALPLILIALLVFPYLIPLPTQPDLPAEKFVEANGKLLTIGNVQTYVVELGPKDGSPVLFVHGFGGSTFSWRHNLAPLAQAGYRVMALDLKGFGLASKNFEEDYSHLAQADFVAQVLDAYNISTAVLVGHSMGGSVISHFAVKYPARVKALVYVDGAVNTTASSGFNLTTLTVVPPIRRAAQIALRLSVDERYLKSRLQTAYADPNFVTPDLLAGYATQIKTKDWDLALMAIMRDGGKNTLTQPLSTIRVPVLIVWGENDTWVPLARGEALRAALPQAEWATFAGAGHLPMEETPRAFNARLLQFLQRFK